MGRSTTPDMLGYRCEHRLRCSRDFHRQQKGKNLRRAKAFLDYALEEETGYSGFAGYMLYRASEGVSIGRLFRSRPRPGTDPDLVVLDLGIWDHPLDHPP